MRLSTGPLVDLKVNVLHFRIPIDIEIKVSKGCKGLVHYANLLARQGAYAWTSSANVAKQSCTATRHGGNWKTEGGDEKQES